MLESILRLLRLTIVLYLLAIFLLLVPPSILLGKSILGTGEVSCSSDRVKDVVVVDGTLRLEDCVVNGKVYTFNSDVTVTGDTILLGVVTINQGIFRLENLTSSAYIASEIVIFDGQLEIDGHLFQKTLTKKKILEVPIGKQTVKIIMDPSPLSKSLKQDIKRYLLFDRPVPTKALESVEEWDFSSLSLQMVRSEEQVNSFAFANNQRLGLVTIQPTSLIESSIHVVWENSEVILDLVVIAFQSQTTSERFWNQISQFPSAYLSASFISSFGEGAHWMFRVRQNFCSYWTSSNYFVAVVCEFKSENVQLIEAIQFREKILSLIRIFM